MRTLICVGLYTLLLTGPLAMAADEAPSAGSKAAHDAMMKGMSSMQSMKMSGDPDRDFTTMMIHHHQQAIDMARAELRHGKNADVRKKAQEIIATKRERHRRTQEAWRRRSSRSALMGNF